MSNTKHTPGPWSISSACKNAINAERNNKLIGIGTTYHDPDSVYFIGQDEAIANARLIAAAPELLELARYILDHPRAAAGMGDTSHAEWVAMQERAKEAWIKATQP